MTKEWVKIVAQQLLDAANEINKNPNYRRVSWVVKGGAGKKVFLKNE